MIGETPTGVPHKRPVKQDTSEGQPQAKVTAIENQQEASTSSESPADVSNAEKAPIAFQKGQGLGFS